MTSQGTAHGRFQRAIHRRHAGPGVAMNVRGKAFLKPEGVSPHTREIVAGTIAPGEDVDVRVTPFVTAVWANAEGFLTYTDLTGKMWRTAFRCPADGSGMFTFEADAPAPTDYRW
jgi:hypothetical protein